MRKHNHLRAIHDAPPMTLDREMCNSAAQWGKHFAELGYLVHSTQDQIPNQGENLSMSCYMENPQTVKEAVTSW